MVMQKLFLDSVCPFDSHYAVIVEYLEKTDIFKIDGIFDTVKIDMEQRVSARIFIYQGVRRAGYVVNIRNIKASGKSLDKGSFAASEVTCQGDYGSGI